MKSVMPKAATGVFLETIESQCFMFGEAVSKAELPDCEGTYLQAVQSYWGDNEGWVMIVVPETVATDIARNVLGLDDDEIARSEIVDDAVSELLNVISGHLVCASSNEGTDIRLAPPTLNRIGAEAAAAMREDPKTTGFVVDGRPVLMGMGSGRPGA